MHLTTITDFEKVRNVSGVYAIGHKESGTLYFGSSKNILKRWHGHVGDLNKNIHTNPKLQNYWNKYSKDAFDFMLAEECKIEDLQKREQFYMDFYKSWDTHGLGFNCGKSSYCPSRGRKHSEETRLKMSEAQKRRIANGTYKNPMRGKVFTKEHKRKLKDAIANRKTNGNYISPNKGKPMTVEVKEKMRIMFSGINNPNCKPVLQYTLDDVFIKEYFSAIEACKQLNLPHRASSGVGNTCCGRQPSAYGFKWKYKI